MKRLIGYITTLLLLASMSLTAAQDAAATISPALEKQLQSIEAITERLRGLKLTQPIVRQFPSREEVTKYLTRSLEVQLNPEVTARESAFYRAFNLLPAGTDLRQVYQDFLTSPAGVGGFYDTDTKKMNVLLITGKKLGDALPTLEQVVYAHEYTHALQDQNFKLSDILKKEEDSPDNPDRALAILSLIEGDATVSMTLYLQDLMQKNPLAAVGMLVQGAQAGAFTIPDKTPPFLVSELTFPYESGMSFVLALYRDGGWARVNEAFSKLPESTEQILHPPKYLADEKPVVVKLKPDSGLSADWKLAAERTLGEFYLTAYLRTQLSISQSETASAGWGGDTYRLYTRADKNKVAFILRLAWDTPADATEFTDNFKNFGAARFKDGQQSGDCWSNASEALCYAPAADGTLVASAPTLELAQQLLANQK